MKCLMVTPYLGEVYGGPSKCVLELAEAIAHHTDHITQLDIVTTNANGNDDLDVPLDTWMNDRACRIRYFPRLGAKHYTFSPSLTRWLFQNTGHYDIVHTHTVFSYPVLPAHIACHRYRVPYIRTPHGMLEPWALAHKAQKKRLYYRWLEQPFLNRAAAVHTLAPPEHQNLQQLKLTSSVVTIPNGIHTQEFERLPSPDYFFQQFPHLCDKTLILFLGRIDPKKGLDLLIPAFASLRSQFPSAHLILAGPDSNGYRSTAETLVKQAQCEDSITFTGMLMGDAKLAALAAAQVYTAPSYSEGFSMSVLEAMACGLPCVITTGCNFPEAAQAQAAHVVDIDAEAIATALHHCLRHPNEAKALGDRARKLILENYTWDIIAKRMIETYQTIVA